MDGRPYRVHVIVDPCYAECIRSISPNQPAWVVDSADNRRALQYFRNDQRPPALSADITSFMVDHKAGPEDWLIAELPVIELHHGQLSHVPPYSVLNVIGVRWSERIQQELRRLGFDNHEPTPNGFVTTRHVDYHPGPMDLPS